MAYRDPTPEEWLDLIDEGLEYRRKFGIEDLWGTFEATYYNVHESMLCDGPNIFLSQGDAMLSMVTVPTPRIKVRPTKPEEVDRAPMVQTLDNQLLRELGIATEMETSTLHAYLFGKGILKIGYDSEFGYDPQYDLGGNLQLGLTLTQLDPRGKRRIEYNDSIAPGSPWVKAVMPHDFVVPWGVKEIEHAPWVAHRIVRHIEDLRADSKYSYTRNLQPQLSMKDFVDSYAQTNKNTRTMKVSSKEAEYVELWEIHDRRTGKILVVTRDMDRFLRKDDNVLQIENKLPFISVGFTPSTRSFWVTPDVYYLYHIQNELSDVARQRTKQRRIATLKFLYDGDALSDQELQKILSPDVGVAAKVESGRDIGKAITKLENTPNMALAQEEDLLRANAREQIGFSRNQLGEFTGGRKSATEASIVDQAARLRMSRRGVAIKRAYEDLIRVVNNVVFSFWTLPRYVNVLGEEKATQWMQVNGPSLKGRYVYDVDFTEEAEMRSKKLEALNLYGLLAQDPSVDPTELRNYLVNEINDPSFERLFNANVRNAMSEMQPGGGGVQSQGPQQRRTPSPVSQLLNQNGQANISSAAGLLAGGRQGA